MPVSYKDSASVAATSITLPSHAFGDLILIFASRSLNTTPPSAPVASGTVPTWTTITANTGSNQVSMRVAYAIATATNTTSGTWTNASRLTAVVLSGVKTSNPIGANSEAAAADLSTNVTAPAITLSDTSGQSAILHYFLVYNNSATAVSWNAAPSGYTSRISGNAASFSSLYRLLTKDTTTTDGAVTNTVTNGVSGRAASIEILSAPAGFFAFF